MPDIFLDHFVFAGSLDRLIAKLIRLRTSGGRLVLDQEVTLGGNAFNFGLHAARLGCSVTLVASTAKYVFELVRQSVRGLDYNTDHLAVTSTPPLTIALEFIDKGRNLNYNINSPGALANFGAGNFPKDLLESHFDLIGFFNWTNNLLGTQLAESVLPSFNCIKLFDTPDPLVVGRRAPELRRVLDLVDIVCCNEVEACSMSTILGKRTTDPLEASLNLASQGLLVGLHAKGFTAEVNGSRVTKRAWKKAKVLRVTGAGDAWTAAFALSYLDGVTPELRLKFANWYARTYLMDENERGVRRRSALRGYM